jgi:hypothetical protein
MKRLSVVSHLTAAEIDRRYRDCPNAAEKIRWHVLWPTGPARLRHASRPTGRLHPGLGAGNLKRYNQHGPITIRVWPPVCGTENRQTLHHMRDWPAAGEHPAAPVPALSPVEVRRAGPPGSPVGTPLLAQSDRRHKASIHHDGYGFGKGWSHSSPYHPHPNSKIC